MNTCSIIRGDGGYYIDAVHANYYAKHGIEGGEPPGIFVGRAATFLGVEGKVVTRSALKRVLLGFSPNDANKKLVQNAGKPNRIKGFDLTFAPHKSVSVLWATSPSWLRERVELLHEKAVDLALSQYFDPHAILTRVGSFGDIEHANALQVRFTHSQNRNNEAHLHTHALTMNACLREDGNFGALYSKVHREPGKPTKAWNPIFEHKDAVGSVYQVEFASLLTQELGIKLEKSDDGFSFRVAGIPQEACDQLSSRSKEVEREKERLGLHTGKASHFAALNTRSSKKKNTPRPELFNRTKELLKQHGISSEYVERLCDQATASLNKTTEIRAAIQTSTESLLEHEACFQQSELTTAVCNKLVHKGFSSSEILNAINKEITEGELVSIGHRKEERLLSSKAILKLEWSIAQSFEKAAGNRTHAVASKVFDNEVRKTQLNEKFNFSKQYLDALKYLTIGIRPNEPHVGQLRVLSGAAGSGKSTTLKTARRIWEASGYRVVGASLYSNATKQLEKASGIKSSTIEKWNIELEKSVSENLKHEATMAVRDIAKEKTWSNSKQERFLDSNTVLVIDEAATCDTVQLAKLVKEAIRAKALVVLSGDDNQTSPIGFGGAFSLAASIVGEARLEENFRQKDVKDQEMLVDASQGKSIPTLQSLIQRNRLHVETDSSSVKSRLISDWQRLGGIKQPEENKILVVRNEDRLVLNSMAQERRILAARRFFNLGLKNHEGQRIYVGDTIQFRENQYVPKVSGNSFVDEAVLQLMRTLPGDRTPLETINNGQFGKVLAIDPFKRKLKVKLDDGRVREVYMDVLDESKRSLLGSPGRHPVTNKPFTRPAAISLGYATTTPLIQGSQFRNAFVYADHLSTQENIYVQLSRATHQTHVYTNEVDAGRELTTHSKLNDARNQGELDTADLEREVNIASLTPGDRLQDSYLAKAMARSRKKTFAIDEMVTELRAEELERQINREKRRARR